MSRVSLRQIAERIGCSRSTVSYALKNHPSISQAMRERVKRVANELGWTPDAELAKQMSLVRNTLNPSNLPNLALVIHKSSEDLKHEWAPRGHFEGARQYAAKMGYSVDVFNLIDNPLSVNRLKGILQARGIQGVIYIATLYPAIPLEYLEMGHAFSCSVAGVRFPEEPFHVSTPDWVTTGRLAISKLLEMGFKRPGTIMPKGVDRPLGWGFGAGVFAGMMEMKPKDRLPLVYTGEEETYISKQEYQRCVDWIIENKPDVILTTDLVHMPEILDHPSIRRRKLSFFALDGHSNGSPCKGVVLPHEEVGRGAVELVISQLHQGVSGLPEVQQSLQIEGTWVG